ncbi:hypothetical protein BV898_16603 [Hypsibius exemplaris]|uniref:G-protein coupled receptors family 1 profile domain-containing protein n=1 Tax=Hypsibius exemplaris TaxID=2072580 RepID=A0A9X6NDT3_HYPEX|nr:hypothetical protein BV898_16603 [Hypsibius exemplaris]
MSFMDILILIVYLAPVVAPVVLGWTLNILVNFSMFTARKKLTGADNLIINHCWINFLVAVVMLAPLTSMWFQYGEAWQFSLVACYTWSFSYTLLIKASGISLTVLGLHQIICLMTQILPTSRCWAGLLRRCRRHRQPLFILWLITLVASVWIVPLGTMVEHLRFRHLIWSDNETCTFAIPAGVTHFLPVGEIMTFWMPTITSAVGMIFLAIFGIFFRTRLRAIISCEKKASSSVLCARRSHGDFRSERSVVDNMENTVMLVKPEDAELVHQERGASGRAEQREKICLRNQTTDSSGRNSHLLTSERGNEFSRDSMIVWIGLVVAHFVLIVLVNALELTWKYLPPHKTNSLIKLWPFLRIVPFTIKICLVDFLIILLSPQYRQFVSAALRRACG